MAQVNLDTASRLDITCRKGDSFELGIDFGVAIPVQGPVDGTVVVGEWKMEVRTSQNEETTPIYATVYSSNGVLDASSDFSFVRSDGDASNSKLTIRADAADMDTSGEYVYDLQHRSTGINSPTVKTYLYGRFTVVEDVTNT